MDDIIRPPRQNYKKNLPVNNDQQGIIKTDDPLLEPFIPPDNVETIDLDIDEPKEEFKFIPKAKSFRKKLMISVAICTVLLFIAGLLYKFEINPTVNTKSHTVLTVAKVVKINNQFVAPLTGELVSSASLASRPVTGLMIENSLAARPQSGLVDAGVVFEAVAEGGITRFLALYQEAQPQYIGPIRSTRPYFIDFALGFDASLGHVGGSPDALSDIKTLNVKDLDEFYNGSSYWRITSRAAPHNVYTSFAKLDALNQAKGYTSSTFTPFVRKNDVPQTPTASSIDFEISGSDYNPHYQYDPSTNSYLRFQDGQPHTDQQTGTQISPKVVIALVMPESLAADKDHTIYADVGSGKMYVFQDGIVSIGTWSKNNRQSQFVFKDLDGLPMKLNTGQTWISIVGNASDVTYKN